MCDRGLSDVELSMADLNDFCIKLAFSESRLKWRWSNILILKSSSVVVVVLLAEMSGRGHLECACGGRAESAYCWSNRRQGDGWRTAKGAWFRWKGSSIKCDFGGSCQWRGRLERRVDGRNEGGVKLKAKCFLKQGCMDFIFRIVIVISKSSICLHCGLKIHFSLW